MKLVTTGGKATTFLKLSMLSFQDCTKSYHTISRIMIADTLPSIVFSFWTSTLDLIAKGLLQASITHTCYDGETSQANRSLALRNFRQDPSISVILMTISCSAVG
jgi:SNF2 family DNA or RNA helicase